MQNGLAARVEGHYPADGGGGIGRVPYGMRVRPPIPSRTVFMDNPDIATQRIRIPMASNTLRARLVFSFKGESLALDTVLDLDQCVEQAGAAPDFHLLLAKAGGIDPYSYLYEALESHEIEFSEATGIATLCCRDSGFDWPEFERLRQDERDMEVVRGIAARVLGVGDLDARADLKAALLAAYRAGKGEMGG